MAEFRAVGFNYRVTKNVRGFNKTVRRRPLKPNSNWATCGPAWMSVHHSLDKLNWLKATREQLRLSGITAANYRPELYV